MTTAPDDVVLCINSGSSSLKFALFVSGGGKLRAIASGSVDRIGSDAGSASIRASNERKQHAVPSADHTAALETAFSLLAEVGAPPPTLVGHRIVHGGPDHVEPVRIDGAFLASLKTIIPIAPLHLPAAIAGIEVVSSRLPDLPQVACFDTAFHATMPELARRLPLPERFHAAGVRRYGFHGLSYEYVMSTLGDRPPARIVIAHLGNGSSLVAVKNGKAIDTTMGFTPAGGVLMGTRTGDLDPGVLLYLLREKGLSADALERLVDREGGLTAIGGVSDVKTLLERAPTDERAKLAVSMFGYAVRKAIGAFTAALSGIDLLVFTGGIGEHAAEIRAVACHGLGAFGIQLEDARNDRNEAVISSDSSSCTVRVVETNEDLVIARHARRVVRGVLVSW